MDNLVAAVTKSITDLYDAQHNAQQLLQEDYAKRFRCLETQCQQLVCENKKLEENLDELKLRQADSDKEIQNLKTECQKLKEDNNILLGRINSAEKNIESISTKVNDSLPELASNLENLRCEHDTSKEEIVKSKNDFLTMLQRLTKETDSTKKEFESTLRSRDQQVKKDLSNLEHEFSVLIETMVKQIDNFTVTTEEKLKELHENQHNTAKQVKRHELRQLVGNHSSRTSHSPSTSTYFNGAMPSSLTRHKSNLNKSPPDLNDSFSQFSQISDQAASLLDVLNEYDPRIEKNSFYSND